MLLRASFFLFVLALLNGLAIPMFLNPRLALSAHLTGLMNSFVLVSLALAFHLLHASATQKKWIRWMFLFGAYMIWFTNVLGAAWGTNWLTPMAGKGYHAELWQQLIVAGMIMFTVMVYIAAATFVVWALRRLEEDD
jgi:hydroxylaminobenzene mutase